MKLIFFIFSVFLLLFTNLDLLAQKRIEVKVESLFSFEPINGWYSKESLSPVVTYIEALREYEPTAQLTVIDSLSWGYKYYTQRIDTTLLSRVIEYIDAEYRLAPDSTQQIADLSDFPHSPKYEEHFNSDIMAIKRYFATPIAKFDSTLRYNPFGSGDLQSLFHTFQTEVSGADISLFSPPRLNSSLPQEVYIKDITRLLYYNNSLVVVELTGKQLKELLESNYGRRYYQIKNNNSDLLCYRLPAYLHIGVSGVEFTLNLSKPRGRRIENWKLENNSTYQVAMNSFLARDLEITKELGDYKTLFIEWLKETDKPLRCSEKIDIQPQRVIKEIEKRETLSIEDLKF